MKPDLAETSLDPGTHPVIKLSFMETLEKI